MCHFTVLYVISNVPLCIEIIFNVHNVMYNACLLGFPSGAEYGIVIPVKTFHSLKQPKIML